ncbi:hypothetical protein [Streptacidiphilus sp. PAMC 29251]
MARQKSMAQQLLDAYQAKQKAKAAAVKKGAAERDRLAKKAERDRLQRERRTFPVRTFWAAGSTPSLPWRCCTGSASRATRVSWH